MNATGTDQTFRFDLSRNVASLFASTATIDLATGLPVGGAFNDPDNLAIDHDGNI